MRKSVNTVALPFENDVDLPLSDHLRRFEWKGTPTTVRELSVEADEGVPVTVETFTNEFWTARQRAAHSLHEVSYRACFKPQLPRFFIDRLTQPGDVVYDPFMGRGTTLIEAALLDRRAYGCDINPLSRVLCEPRLSPPDPAEVEHALAEVDFADDQEMPGELLAFYHPDTLRQICALRNHLLAKQREDVLTPADRWVRMVAVNRLTGHSSGFFSVYTLPPNQAVSARSQERINARRAQTPPVRDVPAIVMQRAGRSCATAPPQRVRVSTGWRITTVSWSVAPRRQQPWRRTPWRSPSPLHPFSMLSTTGLTTGYGAGSAESMLPRFR